MTNQEILTCWWVLDHFRVSKCPKKMGTALKRHKLSIDVIVTLHVHLEIQQINTSNKILQKDVTMYLFCCNQFSFLFLFIIPLILLTLSLFQISHQILFLAFNYTIVSKLSQLLIKPNNFTLRYFMCCLKIIFIAVNASSLIKRLPLERKLKNAMNKIYSLAKVSYFLKK